MCIATFLVGVVGSPSLSSSQLSKMLPSTLFLFLTISHFSQEAQRRGSQTMYPRGSFASLILLRVRSLQNSSSTVVENHSKKSFFKTIASEASYDPTTLKHFHFHPFLLGH